MSAFVVEDKVINDIVTYLATARRYGSFEYHDVLGREFMVDMTNTDEVTKLAADMFQLNVNAVNQRYGDNQAQEFRPLDFAYRRGMPVTAIQAYKSLGCWLYQCMEGDVPKTSLLYAAMERVHAEMAHNIVRAMPAYDKANW